MRRPQTINIVGAHAEGEVGRVVTGGIGDIPGATMREKLRYLVDEDPALTRFLLYEPRGCAQMTVNLLVPSTSDGADIGFIPLQPDGPHAMSGSNAMCVTTVLLETGMVPMVEPESIVVLDTPAGIVKATARCANGKCESVTLDFMPSFVECLDCKIEVEGIGTITVDVAFGGCYFAIVDATSLGFQLRSDEARELVDIGNLIRDAAQEQIEVGHPLWPAFNRIEYPLLCAGSGRHIRNTAILYPGRADRSPCGTGTSARLAVMHKRGQLVAGERIEVRSIIDSMFEAVVTGTSRVEDHPAITTRLTGRAWIFGELKLDTDPSDPFQLGYTLSDTWGTAALP